MTTTTNNQPTALIYCRVSTTEQGASGLGLEAQLAACTAYAEAEGLQVAEIVTEIASAKTAKRTELQRALDLLDQGKASRLIVAKVDRLSRNLLDLCQITERGEAKSWTLAALDLPLDLSTAAGRFTLQMMGAAAELERRMISDRTKAALAAAKARGVKVGRPRRIPAATYHRAHELRSEGLSYQAVADLLNAEGHRQANGTGLLTFSNVRRITAALVAA